MKTYFLDALKEAIISSTGVFAVVALAEGFSYEWASASITFCIIVGGGLAIIARIFEFLDFLATAHDLHTSVRKIYLGRYALGEQVETMERWGDFFEIRLRDGLNSK